MNCKACRECNGLACGNTLPGPGSKAPGNGANDNWKAWKSIKLNYDTFVPDGPVDTSTVLFGKKCSLPLLMGPIGTLLQYSKEDVTTAFNEDMIRAASETGIIDCFADGLVPETMAGAGRSVGRYPGCALPVFNPLENGVLKERIKAVEDAETLGVAVVVDSAGLSHWRGKVSPLRSKTVEELKELRACTKKPFIVKSIMTVKGALQALEAGADAIVVSNHGGRALPDVPATAEVLPEIAEAVKGKMTIIVDGGIRHGSDILKALALGADAVMIFRPFVPVWFGGGAEGIKLYIEMLTDEFSSAMYMTGARKVSDIGPEMVRR